MLIYILPNEQALLYPIRPVLAVIGKCTTCCANGLIGLISLLYPPIRSVLTCCTNCLIYVGKACANGCARIQSFISRFIPDVVADNFAFISNSFISAAVTAFFFGYETTDVIVYFLITFLFSNCFDFVIGLVEKMVRGGKSKTHCSGYNQPIIIIIILLLTMACPASAVVSLSTS